LAIGGKINLRMGKIFLPIIVIISALIFFSPIHAQAADPNSKIKIPYSA